MTDFSSSSGKLYVVATPIGNLEDITLRALRILKEVDLIAAEDTRHTKKLLNHYGISTPLTSYYREQETRKADKLIESLKSGQDIALVTDAGTPGISDPGAVIVQKVLIHKIDIIPIPGASALTAAISCSGIGENSFRFYGFSPAKSGQRKKLLQTLVHADHHIVFYEAPHRVKEFARDALSIFGNRDIIMARELTKAFEEIRATTLDSLANIPKSDHRGEFVIIVAPGKHHPPDETDLTKLLVWYRDHSGLSLKDTCRNIAGVLGVSRSEVYQKALEIWKK